MNRNLVVCDNETSFNEYKKSNRNTKNQKTSSSEECSIDDVIVFCNSNRKEKNVRKDTKDLLIQYLESKYSNYETKKKKKK